MSGRLSHGRPHVGETSIAGDGDRFVGQIRNEACAVAIATICGNLLSQVREHTPERRRLRCIFRRQHADGSFTRKVLGRRADGRVVENEYLKAPEHFPHGLIIVRSACLAEVIAQRSDKGPHVVVSGPRPVEAVEEGLSRAELSCPLEHVLVRAINLSRGAGRGNGQFIPSGPEVRILDCLCNLPDDLLEDCVAR